MISKQKGFTLAEVLVTLAIIGVVAALTIPSLIQSTRNVATVTGVKKAYSTFSNTYELFNADDETMVQIWKDVWSGDKVFNKYAAKLNLIKKCGINAGCFPDVVYKNLDGTNYFNLNSAWHEGAGILADGSHFAIWGIDDSCTADQRGDADPANPLRYVCGGLMIDINGFKGPNQFGRDLFKFYITKTALIPYGYSYVDDCTTSNLGETCAYKIIKSGKVDY